MSKAAIHRTCKNSCVNKTDVSNSPKTLRDYCLTKSQEKKAK